MFVSMTRQVAAHPVRARAVAALTGLLLVASLLPVTAAGPLGARPARAASPTSVTLVGSLQSELGCAGDWDPGCAATAMTDQGNGVYLFSGTLPAGSYEYKIAINGTWDENYGAGGQPGGANIAIDLAQQTLVRFYYDHKTHYITDSRSARYTLPGSFNSELGCPGDWQPDCLRTLMADPDGDGVFTFVTTSIPAGSYEFKVAVDEAWSTSYGAGGGSDNVPFTVVSAGSTVTFTFNSATHVPDVQVKGAEPSHDNNVEWDGLRHDSRDTLYRAPGGAVTAGTPVRLRFRTFHNDVTSVKVRLYDLNESKASTRPMKIAAADVTCRQADLAGRTCDYWELTLPNTAPDNYWYRFVVTDGTDTDYYADDTPALDGGLGATTDDAVDQSWALMVTVPGFKAPSWAKDAVIYQIFPDRFRNGRKDNDLKTGAVRYDDPVLRLGWGTNPEGYCRNYADGATSCPWRFDTTPPADSPTKEQPRGRDYFGGDLAGVRQQLPYLRSLGVNTIYFNPIFDSGSNHGYDTQDYTRIDPAFGTQKDWDNLVKQARGLGVRIVLDGVFNHMSSDSPFFDRYGHYATIGACESVTSAYRSWFTFHDVAAGTGTCAGTNGPKSATYEGWFGFDSIPVLTKTLPAVQQYFLTNGNSITNRWLAAGASGWRLDVAGDSSFPAGYWETFRAQVKATNPNALTISETWQKDSTLLRMLRGDRLDTTMNYRLRDAVLGFLAPGSFDSKGFPDSGRVISAAELLGRLSSIREDYPDAAYYSLMNLLDSHDTERLLWTLTPGAETTADKEANAANLAAGKARVRLASLIQYTVPGAPTVYYGDEVGMTGDDDPDDRRTYPWTDLGGKPDTALFAHYQALARLRTTYPVLRDGTFQPLLATTDGVAAYGRRNRTSVAVVVVNRGTTNQPVSVPVAGWLRDGVALTTRYAVGTGTTAATTTGGAVAVTVPANGALVMFSGITDLTPTAAPGNLKVANEADRTATVTWTPVRGAVGYEVWSSPVAGGGYAKVTTTPVTSASYTFTDVPNGTPIHVVVTALDAAGNASAFSPEVVALPQYRIGWANTQWPPTMTHTISTSNRTDTVYGQVWIDGVTSAPGATPGLQAQLGFGPHGSDPAAGGWTWVDASFNANAGNNDEFRASLLPETTGSFDYLYRYSTTSGASWLYADLNGPVSAGSLPANPGRLTVASSGDTTAPAVPANLRVTAASPAGIDLAWDAVADGSLAGYEILRGTTAGGPYDLLAFTTETSYSDLLVEQGSQYAYVVRAVDTSFNRSALSAEVRATAEARTVSVVFTVTVPSTTDAAPSNTVDIAGSLDRLDGGLPQWNPGGTPLTRVDATHWTITLTGKEGTSIEYKYALGSWDYVEKDNACGEIGNRQLTLAYGATGTQAVNDTVANWRNVAPCGN